MSVATFQGVVENGQVRLASDVHLPESATVYVVVPDSEAEPSSLVLARRRNRTFGICIYRHDQPVWVRRAIG